MAAVLDYPFPHTQKAVMLALANQCNDFGQHCFPSFDLIQRHTSLGRRTIFDALKLLEDEGFVTRVQLRNSQRVEFRVHVERLQQIELPQLVSEDPAGQRAKKGRTTTSAGAAPVRVAHQCGWRTSADGSKTGAGAAPTSAGAALHKAPSNSPKSTHLSPRAGATGVDVRRGIVAGGYPPFRIPATDPRFDAAAAEGVTFELAEAVTREACGQDPPKPVGWIIATARGRIRDAAHPPPKDQTHAERQRNGQGPRRESVAERVRRLAIEGEQRDAAASAAGRAALGDPAPDVVGPNGRDLRPPLDVGVRRDG